MAAPRYSVVVPLYDEEEVLPELYARLRQVLHGLAGPTELVFVNDGSRDGTLGRLRMLHAEDDRVRIVSLSRNFGHQAALSAGLAYAGGEVVTVLDGDLQDPPELLPTLIGKIEAGWDVAYGVRGDRKEGAAKRFAYFAFYRILRALAGIEIPLDAGDFCAMSRRVVDHLNRLPESDRFIRGLRAWLGFRQVGVPYERAQRHAGTPKYTLLKLVKLSLDGLISFSYAPLRLLAVTGFVMALASLIGILAVLYRYLFTPYVPGYTSLVVAVLFIGGLQLFTVGLIGEYVGRISQQVKGRPLFVIDEVVSSASPLPGPAGPPPRPGAAQNRG